MVNKETVWTIDNEIAVKFNEVQVYAGDNFYTAANGQIRRLVIRSKK